MEKIKQGKQRGHRDKMQSFLLRCVIFHKSGLILLKLVHVPVYSVIP